MLRGRAIIKEKVKTPICMPILANLPLGVLPRASIACKIKAGVMRQAIERIIREEAVSIIAFFAHILDIPTFCSNYSSEKTSIPFCISTCLMQKVLRKLAEPEAKAAITELTTTALLPETLILLNSLLSIKPTTILELTAAVYP